MQVTYKLVRYAHQHPETQLTVFEIPQVPGYRAQAGPTRASPIPWWAAAMSFPGLHQPIYRRRVMADYLAWGRYPLHLKQARL